MVSVIRSLNMLSAALLLRRLRRPEKLAKELRDYAGRAKEAVVYRAAAAAWAEGVPFAEALDITSKALQNAELRVAKGGGKNTAGRGKGRGKAARGKRGA